jgi:hypothetical protein
MTTSIRIRELDHNARRQVLRVGVVAQEKPTNGHDVIYTTRSPCRACPKKQMQEGQNMSDEREYVKYQYAVMGCCRQIVNAAATNAAIYFSVLRDDGQGWVEVCRINPAPYNAVVPQRS